MKAHERLEFRALFLEQRDLLFRFLMRLTRNRTDAEDLLQETFLTAWKKRELYRGDGSAVGFLRRTAYRLFLNHHQRAARRASLAPTENGPEREFVVLGREDLTFDGQSERSETIAFLVARVHAALDELPEPTRTAFVLFRYEGLTCAEIAELSGTPLKTIETRLARATELLAVRLRKYQEHAAQL